MFVFVFVHTKVARVDHRLQLPSTLSLNFFKNASDDTNTRRSQIALLPLRYL